LKTDPIFYRLFQTVPSIFFELINHPPEEAEVYQFSSVEIKQTSFRIDGLFLPKENHPELPIYFVEVQFKPDKNFYSRFFTETFMYLDKTELPQNWQGVIIYPSSSLDVGKTERYMELLESGRVRRIYLDELRTETLSIGLETVQLIIESEETVAAKAKQLIGQVRRQIFDDVTQEELINLIETIIVYKLSTKSREEIAIMLGLDEFKQSRLYLEIFQEGQQEGLQQGLQEGERRAKLAVRRLLALGLSVEQIATALELELEQVQQIAQEKLTHPDVN
jgi:predicted transposase/invertase (TIGR01784 family)